jgi:hypothetical protein
MIFSRLLQSEHHTLAFVVGKAGERGWEIRKEADNRIVRRTTLGDWHRVEAAITLFRIEATELRSAGWVEIPQAYDPASIDV